MNGTSRAIRISTAAAVVAVAVIAAYLSYEHAYAVIRTHGETGLTARLEPATIDGLVYSSSMVILYAARHRLAVPALARSLLALGIAATLAANDDRSYVNGWAGVSANRDPAVDQAIQPGQQETYRACQPVDQMSARQPAQTAAPSTDAPREDDINAVAVAAYRTSVRTGSPLSERKLAAMFGKTSRRWARSRMAEASQILLPAMAGNPQPQNDDNAAGSQIHNRRHSGLA